MAWNYSGMFVHKKGEEYTVYTSDKFELQMFADKKGYLQSNFISDYGNHFHKDGLFQVFIGYPNTMAYDIPNEPLIYETRFISDIHWGNKKE